MIRRRCVRRGHRWSCMPWPGVVLPIEFCRRWWCTASRAADWLRQVDPTLADALDREINLANIEPRELQD